MLKGCGSFLWRHKGATCVLAGAGWLLLPWSAIVALAAAMPGLILTLWAQRRPASFSRVAGPIRGCWWRGVIRHRWPELTEECRLGSPTIRQIQVAWPHVRVTVRPTVGQTLHHYERMTQAMQLALGASQLRVEHAGSRDLLLIFTVGDQLRRSFDAEPSATWAGPDSIAVGRTERGQVWRLALGPHTLVAGCSGSGKGSVFWSIAFALAGGVRAGVVELHGIDLKGGMEIRMGDALFSTTATDELEAVASLERLVDLMRSRNESYAGRLRAHQPTADEPMHVVMIDELAALTAYCSDRDAQRRAERAINLLCSQGRASGFMVVACLQDPRKEVIPSRGLFTQMVGLRLKDLSETVMVLGDLALYTGAHCHRITRDVPGTGYVVPEDGSAPIRVRAGYASDESIRSVATRFATPHRHIVPRLELPERRRTSREPA